MSDWATYSLQDFIPFSLETYQRMLERLAEAYWPLYPITLMVGLASVILAFRKPRWSYALLSTLWLSSGLIFLFQFYRELNWAADWFGWVFILQALVLILTTQFHGSGGNQSRQAALTPLAAALIGVGLLYPLVAPASGQGWLRSEVIGIHPEPTSLTTLGLLLFTQQGWRFWLVFMIPFAWLLYSSLTLYALAAEHVTVVLVAITVALLASVAKVREGRR